jgi:hypothetical protein
MQVRPILAAVALVAGATAFVAPGTSPVTARFKIVETSHQVVDLSAFSQPEQVSHIVKSTFVTVMSNDSAGGRTVKVVIDSVHADSVVSPQPIDPAMFDSLRGAAATGWIAADGKLTLATDTTARGAAAGMQLRALFPQVKPRAKVGDHWTDTTEVNGSGNGLMANAVTRRVTNWAVSAEQTVNGVKARKFDAAFSQSMNGEMTGPQGTMAIDGTGTGTATFFLGADGRQVGAQSTLTLQVSVTVPQAPEPIPVNGTISSVITAIR